MSAKNDERRKPEIRGIQLTSRDIERFMKLLENDPVTGCLLFTGHTNSWGYGQFLIGNRPDKNRRMEGAHRVAFVINGGIITIENPQVIHSCDNPRCCNPSHLRAGTNAENQADKAIRGRGYKTRSGLPFGAKRNRGKFLARALVNGKMNYFGSFATAEEASTAALAGKLGQ